MEQNAGPSVSAIDSPSSSDNRSQMEDTQGKQDQDTSFLNPQRDQQKEESKDDFVKKENQEEEESKGSVVESSESSLEIETNYEQDEKMFFREIRELPPNEKCVLFERMIHYCQTRLVHARGTPKEDFDKVYSSVLYPPPPPNPCTDRNCERMICECRSDKYQQLQRRFIRNDFIQKIFLKHFAEFISPLKFEVRDIQVGDNLEIFKLCERSF